MMSGHSRVGTLIAQVLALAPYTPNFDLRRVGLTNSTSPGPRSLLRQTLAAAQSSSKPNTLRSENHKNAQDAPAPISRAPVRLPVPHPSASPEPSTPRTIPLPRAVADKPSAPRAADQAPLDSLLPAPAIVVERFSSAPAAPASPTASARSWKDTYRQSPPAAPSPQQLRPAARSSRPTQLSSAATPQSSTGRGE